MKTLTRKQLFKAMVNNTYLAVRWWNGDVTGANCRIGLIAAKRFPVDNTQTNIQGFYPITFQEYIRIKTAVIK